MGGDGYFKSNNTITGYKIKQLYTNTMNMDNNNNNNPHTGPGNYSGNESISRDPVLPQSQNNALIRRYLAQGKIISFYCYSWKV